MNRYTIYCTSEQTDKALELGAPIEFQEDASHSDGKSSIDPTAEQMIWWLDEQGISIEIYLSRQYSLFDWSLFTRHKIIKNNKPEAQYYYTRKEAIHAAIDAALDYLTKAKEEQL